METIRECKKCGEIKNIEEFYKDKNSLGGRRRHCKACANDTPSKDYRYRRKYNLKKKYNIDVSDYKKLLSKNDNRCYICGTKEPGGYNVFVVDHCHKTNKIRGLLCSSCNRGLGLFKDDINTLKRAIEYLAVR